MTYSIKEEANQLKITKDTLYYYEKAGLLPPIQRNKQGHRCYTDSDIAWIYLVCCLREIHMPIHLIRNYVALLLDQTSTLQDRKNMLLTFQTKVEAELNDYRTIQQLITKKLDFYDELLAKSSHEITTCYNYQDDWEHFKTLLEEKL